MRQTRANKKLPDYNNYVEKLYRTGGAQDNTICKNITFQVTNDCNLCCDYCYEHHKGKEVMSLETGKKIVDSLLDSWFEDKKDGFLNKNTKALVLEFIGGEPLLEARLIEDICDYFFEQCRLRECPLDKYSKISISTNGQNLFDNDVQHFIEKFGSILSISVSIDGHKELHDLHRKTRDGQGSYDKALKAFNYVSENLDQRHTKLTFVPSSFPQISKAIISMLNLNPDYIAANYAYEPVYTPEDATILYRELKKVSNYILENEIDIYISMLDWSVGEKLKDSDDRNFCGGTGNMLAFTPDGRAFPCLRYCPISIGEDKAKTICVGNFSNFYRTREGLKIKDYLDSITLKSQSTQECIDCPVATGCGWCSGYNFEATGDVNKRVTNICWAHKGRVLAIGYYFNKMYLDYGCGLPKRIRLPEKDILKILSPEEWNELKELEIKAFSKYKKLHEK